MRKATLAIIPLVLFLFALGSCVSFKDPWVGQTGEQLVAKQRAPDSKAADGQGGEVWVYVDHVRNWTRQMTNHGPADVLNDYYVIHQYYIDSTGVIYRHRQTQQ